MLGQALTDNGDYLATGLIAQVSPNSLTLAGRRHASAFTASWRRSACGTAPRRRPEWLGKVRLSWQNEAFSRGQCALKPVILLASGYRYRPPRPSCAANALSMALDAPQRRQHDHPLTFSFSAGTLARSDELANTASFTIRTPLHD